MRACSVAMSHGPSPSVGTGAPPRPRPAPRPGPGAPGTGGVPCGAAVGAVGGAGSWADNEPPYGANTAHIANAMDRFIPIPLLDSLSPGYGLRPYFRERLALPPL